MKNRRTAAPHHSHLGFACMISNNPKEYIYESIYIKISTHSTDCQRFHFCIIPLCLVNDPLDMNR